jgi:hypothetical protein
MRQVAQVQLAQPAYLGSELHQCHPLGGFVPVEPGEHEPDGLGAFARRKTRRALRRKRL